MQAAEAYAAKTRASRSTSSGNSSGTACANGGTWSSGSKTSWSSTPTNSSTNRGRSRPQLTNDTFRPPSRGYGNSRPASRTTSASPGPWRRQRQSSGDSLNEQPLQPPPSSTHSTPCKKPFGSSAGAGAKSDNKMSTSVGNAKSQKTLADLDLEEEDFNKLDAEPYLNKTKCSGNYRMLVCLSSNKNDAKNAAIKEDSFARKSQQCEHCYWYHTAVNVLVDGPSLEESPLLI